MKKLLTLVLLASSFSAFSQDRIPVVLQDRSFYLSILDPGVMFEQRLSDNQSFTATLGITGLANSFEDELGEDEFTYSINPYLTSSFRNYYSRKRVKKELNSNSGNYVGLVAGYYFGALAEGDRTTELTNSFFIGPEWGIQRNYKSGIHFGLSLGTGLATGQNTDVQWTGLGRIRLGFRIK
ncbi:MAG: hypothetical protein AAFX87_08095 [Bacteroidota bacterium]